METVNQEGSVGVELIEELPEWKVDSTFQLRVNNVCAKFIRAGVRPTYHRVRANMGEPPARLLRQAMDHWSARVLPGLYDSKVAWEFRPNSISPRVAELFQEMWLQAVAAAQIHCELGDDVSARIPHRELADFVRDEIKRINFRVSRIDGAMGRLDSGVRAQVDLAKELRADVEWFEQGFEAALSRMGELSKAVEQMLVSAQREFARQSSKLSRQIQATRDVQRIEQARGSRITRIARKMGRKADRRSG